MENGDGYEAFEAQVVCPRCQRNGREADIRIIGMTADPSVGALIGHYRCLSCRWDFIQHLALDPEEAQEFLEEIAAWREGHPPSVRLHRLYLRALYAADGGRRPDLLHRVQAQLIRERALLHPWSEENGPHDQHGMEITGPSGATLQIAFALVDGRWCLVCMGYRHGRPVMPSAEDEAYVTVLFFTPGERRAAARSLGPDAEAPSAVLYVVHPDPWCRSLPLGPGW